MASVAEARLAVESGASLIGLVSEMPSGPGPIPEERIARIAAAAPPGATPVLLTSRTEAAAIVGQARRTGVGAIQLCDRTSPATRTAIREALPDVALLQVVHVTGPGSVGEARESARGSDAVLLDSGRPDAASRELGGTGRTHDWSVSREIREAVEVPVWLAGGLTAENVAAAVRAVEPFGVDVCSGVRTEGRLDPDRLAAFVRALGTP